MVMTEELARRILERANQRGQKLAPAKQTELLMDWLEGRSYKELGLKYGISISQARKIVLQARADATKRLKAKGE